jgi:hypothetical protein
MVPTNPNTLQKYGDEMPKQPKYPHLLKDPDVLRWYRNNERGSKATAQNYLRMLGRWVELTGVSPKELIQMPDEKRIVLVEDFINDNPAGRNVIILKVLRSWLNKFNLRLPKFKLGRIGKPRIANMRIPTPENLRVVLACADVRARAAIAIIALCGQRLEVLGTHEGEDGLVLGDFKDLIIFEQPDPEHPGQKMTDVRWEQKPARLVIRETLSKTRHEFFTFLGQEACEYVSKMLKLRIAAGERLTGQSPLITPKQAQRVAMLRNANPERRFIRTINIADMIRRPMKASRVMDGNPPNIWRSYFQSHAEMSPLQKDWREFMVGHNGDISAVYALHKQLDLAKIEAMRKSFKSLLPFIESRVTLADREQQVAALAAENAELKSRPSSEPRKVQPTQKVVDLKELKESLAFGWTYVARLDDGTYIISRN